MANTKTPFEMAKRVAFLMGGNGLTTEQSVLLIAHELANWRHAYQIRTMDGWVLHPGFGLPPVNLKDDSSLRDGPRARQCGFSSGEEYRTFLAEVKARGHV